MRTECGRVKGDIRVRRLFAPYDVLFEEFEIIAWTRWSGSEFAAAASFWLLTGRRPNYFR